MIGCPANNNLSIETPFAQFISRTKLKVTKVGYYHAEQQNTTMMLRYLVHSYLKLSQEVSPMQRQLNHFVLLFTFEVAQITTSKNEGDTNPSVIALSVAHSLASGNA